MVIVSPGVAVLEGAAGRVDEDLLGAADCSRDAVAAAAGAEAAGAAGAFPLPFAELDAAKDGRAYSSVHLRAFESCWTRFLTYSVAILGTVDGKTQDTFQRTG